MRLQLSKEYTSERNLDGTHWKTNIFDAFKTPSHLHWYSLLITTHIDSASFLQKDTTMYYSLFSLSESKPVAQSVSVQPVSPSSEVTFHFFFIYYRLRFDHQQQTNVSYSEADLNMQAVLVSWVQYLHRRLSLPRWTSCSTIHTVMLLLLFECF